jgi:dolichol-phosphate mannosyltransferase
MSKNSISIICPTLNEAENVELIYKNIARIVKYDWELIFVDDHSIDATRSNIENLARRDRRVRLINRIGRRGLSSAIAEGLLSSIYDLCIVIDADLQHDINNINRMTSLAIAKSLDLIISSRFKKEQRIALTKQREKLSLLGNKLIDLILRRQLTDPLSGCFLIKKDKYIKIHQELFLSGFKILFDILSSKSGRKLKVGEIPIKFLKRHSGESKLRKLILIQFIWTFVLRYIERYIPLTFIVFCLVGSLGYLLHFLILSYFLDQDFFPFSIAQLITSYVVMLNNFWLNNAFTFSASKLRGIEFFNGLLKFMFFCSLGAFFSLAIASYMLTIQFSPIISGMVGAISASLWNYVLNYKFTWKNF